MWGRYFLKLNMEVYRGIDKINVELSTVELTRLILGLEQRIELMKTNNFCSVIDEHKRLLKRLKEVKRNHINNNLINK